MCFDSQLSLFFRDELMLWPWHRNAAGPPLGPAGPGSAVAGSPELKALALANMTRAMERCTSIAPRLHKDAHLPDNSIPSVQRGVSQLVEQALSPKNLCRLDATWHPWF